MRVSSGELCERGDVASVMASRPLLRNGLTVQYGAIPQCAFTQFNHLKYRNITNFMSASQIENDRLDAFHHTSIKVLLA
jgi:hypothetical protein